MAKKTPLEIIKERWEAIKKTTPEPHRDGVEYLTHKEVRRRVLCRDKDKGTVTLWVGLGPGGIDKTITVPEAGLSPFHIGTRELSSIGFGSSRAGWKKVRA